jgi:hypothetical protein
MTVFPLDVELFIPGIFDFVSVVCAIDLSPVALVSDVFCALAV